jgi:hypothetical protein
MLKVPAFGKGIGAVSVLLGVVGVAAASVLLVDPLSANAFVGVLALIVFHLVVGWKLYGLSRARRSLEDRREGGRTEGNRGRK